MGIHYIGNLNTQTSAKTLSDQLTNGQLQWAPIGQSAEIGLEWNGGLNLCLIWINH